MTNDLRGGSHIRCLARLADPKRFRGLLPAITGMAMGFALLCVNRDLAAQRTDGSLKLEIEEIMDALDGRHPTLSPTAVIRPLRRMEPLPEAVIRKLITNVCSPESRLRVAPRVILGRVEFDLDRATLLMDALGTHDAGHQADDLLNSNIQRWTDWVTQPGQDVIPLLHQVVVDPARTSVQRAVALQGLATFKVLPDSTLSELIRLLVIPHGPWSEAALIVARHGEPGERKLLAALDGENDWQRARAAAGLEITFPRKHPGANRILLEIAGSTSRASREAARLLGQTGPYNALSLLHLGKTRDDAFGSLAQLSSRFENRPAILRDCLPVLKEWLREVELQDAALRGYRAIGADNLDAMRDLAAALHDADRALATKITHIIMYYGGEAGVKAAAGLLAQPKTRAYALRILQRSHVEVGPISQEIVQQLQACESEEPSHELASFKNALKSLLNDADELPAKVVVDLMDLARQQPVYRGNVQGWLKNTAGTKAAASLERLQAWNGLAALAEFGQDNFSRENVHGKTYSRRAACSPDGRWLAVMEQDQLRLLEIATGECVRTVSLPDEVDEWFRPSFDNASQLLAASDRQGLSWVWDVGTGKLLAHHALGLTFLSDPAHWLRMPTYRSEQQTKFQFVEAESCEVVGEFEFEPRQTWRPRFEEAGGILAIHAESKQRGKNQLHLEVREVPTGKLLKQATYPLRNTSASKRACGQLTLRLSAEGRLLALMYSCGYVEIRRVPGLDRVAKWDSGAVRTRFAHPRFTADERALVFAGTDGCLRIWKFPQTAEPRKVYTGLSNAFYLLGQGKWILQPDFHGEGTVVIADLGGQWAPSSIWLGGETLQVSALPKGRYCEIATNERIWLFDATLFEKYFVDRPD